MIGTAVSLVAVSAAGAADATPREASQGRASASPSVGIARQQPAPSGPRAGTVRQSADPIDYSTVRFDRVVRAVRVTTPIVIDGRLDEAAWELAQPASHFTQWEPNSGMPASDETEVRFLYDDNNLYIGVRCFDRDPGHLTVNELRKDFDPGQDDGIGIVLDTLHDRQTGFLFQTNPAGARRDAQVSQDGEQTNADWDGVWDVKTGVDAKGWIAEIVIPFKTLRFTSASKQEWGLNILRRVRRANEDSYWVPLERRYWFGRVSMAGTLTGIDTVSGGRNFKLKPYALFNATRPEDKPREFKGDGGFDLKYGLTKAMTLDATYRTDFSQVEVDQQQVNLTRFSVFFPEKREFFLENSGVFAVPGAGNVIPFFSRQIGLGEQTNEEGDEETVPIPIVGGARASGKAGTYDVGLLAMRTGRDTNNPADTFLVGRVRKNLPGSSTIGALVTSRDSTVSGDYNRLYGVDSFLRFFQKLEVTSYLFRTESPALKGRDQSHLVNVTWRDNDFNVGGRYEQVQPNFNPEVGFVGRGSMTHYSTDTNWRPRPRNNSRIRNFDFGVNTDYYGDPDGRMETREQRLSAGIAFQDSSNLSFELNNTLDRLDESFDIFSTDQRTVTLPVGEYRYLRYGIDYNPDRSHAFSTDVNIGGGEFWDGHNRSLHWGVQLKPNYHLRVEFTLERNDARLREGNFTTQLVGVRTVYAFTSRAFLNAFLQYNSTEDEFSANTRFNIIHRPLSDFFIVYNERRNTVTGALIDRGLAVKFTNLFDF